MKTKLKTTLRVGDTVRCKRAMAPKGTWSKYNGRIGTIATINTVDSEIGIRFTKSGTEATTWFGYDELVAK